MADPEHADLIIHVGLHKTGTTSVQDLLGSVSNVWQGTYLGRPYEDRREGLPDTRTAVHEFLERDGSFAALVDQLANERTRGPVSLSDEMFTPAPWNHSGRSARHGRALIESADLDVLVARVEQLEPTRIVLTTRQPQPLLRSHYLYTVHLGYRSNYRKYLADLLELGEGRVRDYFDVRTIAEKWGRIAPVSTFALEDLTSSSPAVTDFLNTMLPGVAPPGSTPRLPHTRPDELHREGIAAILLLNRFRTTRYGRSGFKMRRFRRWEGPFSFLTMKALPPGLAARPWNDGGLEARVLALLGP